MPKHDVLAVELLDGSGVLHRAEVETYAPDNDFVVVFDGALLEIRWR